MHTRDSAFRMQLSTWTGWLLSFLSACDSEAKRIHVRVGQTRDTARDFLVDRWGRDRVCSQMYVSLWNCHGLGCEESLVKLQLSDTNKADWAECHHPGRARDFLK